MNCPNCGTPNNNESKFCVKCGASLTVSQNNNVVNQENVVTNQTINNNLGKTEQQNNSNNSVKSKISITEYFFWILAVILKPFTAFKEELNKFNEFKNSAILSLIISGVATIIVLLKTMFDVVRVTSVFTKETKWVWENLKELNYIKIIGSNFLIFLGIILAIACVYYLASLVAKKQISFSRLLGISAVAIVPMVLASVVVAPLLSIIYKPLGIVATIVGGVYTLIIVYEIINNEIKLEGNAKLYLNLACLSTLLTAGYYLFVKIFIQVATNGLDDLLNFFN